MVLFLCTPSDAHCLMVVYVSTKFHENILDGIKVVQQT